MSKLSTDAKAEHTALRKFHTLIHSAAEWRAQPFLQPLFAPDPEDDPVDNPAPKPILSVTDASKLNVDLEELDMEVLRRALGLEGDAEAIKGLEGTMRRIEKGLAMKAAGEVEDEATDKGVREL
jgi:hypothetical protein